MRELCLSFEDVAALAQLPEPLFRDFVNTFTQPLVGAGLDPNALDEPDALWRQRLQLPEDLVDAIHHVRALANDAGVERITEAAGGPLFAGELDRVPLVFATRTRVEQPILFNRVLGRQFSESMSRFREFVGRDGVPCDEPDLAMAAGRIGAMFGRRGKGTNCRIHPWVERDGCRYFSIEHEGIPRLERALLGKQLQLVTTIPLVYDLVVYDVRLQRLRVFAADTTMADLYVRLFGELLFGADDWFHSAVVVDLGPLRGLGSRDLRPTPGVLQANVVRLELASRTAGSGVVIRRAADVLRMLEGRLVDAEQDGPLRAATFRLLLKGEHRLREVHIEVPDVIEWDWRRGNTAIRGFLEERGFLIGLSGSSAWQIA